MTSTSSKTPQEEERIIQIIRRKIYEYTERNTANKTRKICAGIKEIEELDDKTLARLTRAALAQLPTPTMEEGEGEVEVDEKERVNKNK